MESHELVRSASRNPWVALDVSTDPVVHSRVLARAHEAGVGGGPHASNVRELVLRSWERSIVAGVAPDQSGAPVALTADELHAARERSPLAPVVGVIHATLSGLDDDARHIVAIGDEQASLLWVTGDPRTCERALAMRFQEGAAWSEHAAGTNAVGTAAALDHPLQIFAAEHLVAAVHRWACSAAPIHDPATGELIGVVDLTADFRTSHPHTLSVAALVARAAEHALQLRSLELAARLREQWEAATRGRRTPSAVVDAHGCVIASRGAGELPTRLELAGGEGGALMLADHRLGELQQLAGGAILWLRGRARAAAPRLRLQLLGPDASAGFGPGPCERALRSLELLALLAMHPEGLTAEQLALELYGERGKAVTIRAQVHRVRAYLGDAALSTHPYRLNVALDADWVEVKRLISTGRPGDALTSYRGPLLGASDVTEIVAARQLLQESLRRAILTTADPELLSRWLAHPAGADDLAAARTLVAVLPCGDSRRAAATATAAAIARRQTPEPS
ncbi:MAG: GAF domain-containing protein [Solirubrobacteraceae bacterium]